MLDRPVDADRQIFYSICDLYEINKRVSETIGAVENLEEFRALFIELMVDMESTAFNCGWAIAKGDLQAVRDELAEWPKIVEASKAEALEQARRGRLEVS